MEGFRILIVDDESSSSDALGELLAERLPGSKIDIARSRNEARERIALSRSTGAPYDLKLVDLWLPEKIDNSVEEYEGSFDRDFTNVIRRESQESIVFLMTAAAHEPIQHYIDAMNMVGDGARFLKGCTEYPQNIVDASVDVLLGGLIEQKISDSADEAMAKGMTTHLLEIRDLIVGSWKYLGRERQTRIQQYFKVNESVNPPGVSLR